MDKIYIKETLDAPAVLIDKEIGLIEIKGNSTMEDPIKFYQSIIDHLKNLLDSSGGGVTIGFKLAYFNTSSSKWIFQLFKILEEGFKNGKTVIINWYCEADDEVMMEAGEDFQSLLKMPFNIIEE